jgi:acyl-CoA thioester hydrolase
MANTAYLAKAADVRMFFFEEHGFSWEDFMRVGIGPVIQRETLEYRRELRMHEPIDITLAYEGMSRDGSRWILANEFLRGDGQLAARVTSQGGWLDLQARALAVPPPALLEIQRRAPRGAAFEELPGLRR